MQAKSLQPNKVLVLELRQYQHFVAYLIQSMSSTVDKLFHCYFVPVREDSLKNIIFFSVGKKNRL